ncbi:RNA 2',3'-cyclic phosphodiesterase [Saccharopolyspora rhizosphaerae]|uniref:RNA 2',3'-cyclic phosphodiesterase n=1 Tax=Saccharopolyspora rhizosphaerae TaxID=2492662 RepID=A0A3R8P464_9PSEU|nr:2'-5' RNA ligase family protein [Saccharopolyspora rhizosphaerae]RRO16131.1 RNA 2',3'-cyclic phosphodiesterase [Saccharopolyspora rhizosphaerae]
MRLFTALWPSEEAVAHLAGTIAALDPARVTEATSGLRKFRFAAAERWHLTLRFHGDDADPQRVADRLDRRAARVSGDAPRLRLSGSGTFRGVLWVGVEPATDGDRRALGGLVRAADGDPGGFRAHLTVARWASGRADRRSVAGLLTGYSGPWWTVGEIAVMRSDQGEGVPAYRAVHRVPVTRAALG